MVDKNLVGRRGNRGTKTEKMEEKMKASHRSAAQLLPASAEVPTFIDARPGYQQVQ